MKALFARRSVVNGAKRWADSPNSPLISQKLPDFRVHSFRYHLPRRISTASTDLKADKTRWNLHKTDAPVQVMEALSNGHNTNSQSTLMIRSFSPRPFSQIGKELCRRTGNKQFSQMAFRMQKGKLVPQASKQDEPGQTTPEPPKAPPPIGQDHSHLMDRIHLPHLPHMPNFHRPTKEELLAAATGFWSRLRVRFKWFSIRSVRPFNIDEISGFFTWIVLGHLVWIVIGTTTFFSLAILAINTVFAQETLASWVGNYLTKSTGIRVVFESAIVPDWKSGVIKFENVFVSRRPGQTDGGGVSKGLREAAAISAAAANADPNEDTNYTQFDLSINEVLVTLSFAKWFNSKGILQNVEVKGMRGVVDRTNVHPTEEYVDPKSYRHEHSPGDFEIESFKMEDVLVTLHQPNGFRPFTVSIFAADIPQLRKRWLFYDILSANQMHGAFDNSLFTIHPHQNPYIGAHDTHGNTDPWKKHSRIRIDGINIDHVNRGVSGPFSWIHEGNVDIIADIMLPAESDPSVLQVMSDFYERMEAALSEKKRLAPSDEDPVQEGEDERRFMVLDLRIHLNDVRAAVPLFTRELSYVKNALIRPIVGYINSRRTFIPINCRVVKRMSDFDGSWSLYDSGLMEDLSAETYEAFARDVTDDQARLRRMKTVGLWSLQLAAQAIFMGMAGGLA